MNFAKFITVNAICKQHFVELAIANDLFKKFQNSVFRILSCFFYFF